MSLMTFITILFSLFAPTVAETGALEVNISNIDYQKGGVIRIGLYDNSSDFPSSTVTYKSGSVPVSGADATFTFDDLPFGQYALAMYHDMNNDGKMNKNFFGVPKEPYAFSNNAMGILGPPSFEEASVLLSQVEMEGGSFEGQGSRKENGKLVVKTMVRFND